MKKEDQIFLINFGLLSGVLILAFLIGGIFICSLSAQECNHRFTRISVDEGLSQSEVLSVLQDHFGFMWFGTDEGLNRYDGYNFYHYRNDPDDPASISDNSIISLFEDSSGILWIGTAKGLNKYLINKNCFHYYLHNPEEPTSISDNFIRSIYEDKKGNLWVGTDMGGLNLFDQEKEIFIHFNNDPDDPNSISDDSVLSIFEDSTDNLWVGTYKGINKFNYDEGKFIRYMFDSDNPDSLYDNEVFSIYEDSNGVLWVGTGAGLYLFDPEKNRFKLWAVDSNLNSVLGKTLIFSIYEDSQGVLWIGTELYGLFEYDRIHNRFSQIQHNPFDFQSLSSNEIWSIYEDSLGTIWLGTGSGINKLNCINKKFIYYWNIPGKPSSLSNNSIWAFFEDRQSMLWIGTDLGGLNMYDREKNLFTAYKHDPLKPSSISSNCVMSIFEDHQGIFWVGTFNEGLNIFNKKSGSFFKYKYRSGDPTSISSNTIYSIFEDNTGVMWFGTDFGEINKFDRQNKTFSHYTLPLDDLDYSGTNEVWKMYEDSVGRFWICTETGGLYRFDRNNESFERFRYKADDPKSISHDSVLSILEDSSGVLWVGTSAGLNRFDPNNKEFFHYRSKHGLPNEVIYGILEENFPSGAGNNYLWMSTNKGLSRFDPAAEIFRNYDKSDGLQSNEFNSGAYLKSQTGEMFFGGINGFNSFFPDRLTDNNQISPIVITDFKVINQSEFINESSEVESRAHRIFPINESIELGYKENIFSISFAVLHFAPPEKNRYAYKMTGIQEDWTSLGNKNSLLFSRVPPGNYVFSVKGSNCDGIWNEKGISLQIKISPPFWKTAWFKIICYCIAGIILITTHQISTKFIRNRNKKLKELNISLNEQIAGREKAEQRITASLKEKNILLKEIHHRVKNNMQIISSLLNVQARGIRNKEAFNILKDSQARIYSLALVHEKLYQSENYYSIEFNNYLQSMSKNLLELLGHNRNISLDLDVKDIRLGIDLAIPCGLIINELLTNIFKHAFPEGKNGRISITFHSREDGTNQLIVQDNGIGLPKDFNFKNSDTMGMSLVNTLIEQIDAEVKIISEKGTRIEIVFKS